MAYTFNSLCQKEMWNLRLLLQRENLKAESASLKWNLKTYPLWVWVNKAKPPAVYIFVAQLKQLPLFHLRERERARERETPPPQELGRQSKIIRHQKGDTKQVPFWGSTNRCHHAKLIAMVTWCLGFVHLLVIGHMIHGYQHSTLNMWWNQTSYFTDIYLGGWALNF